MGQNDRQPDAAQSLTQATAGESKEDAPSWLFDNIAELSKHVRTLHTIYIGFLIYCVLFSISTDDKRILLNEEAHLPIINADLPFYASVIIASAASISIFIFFQLHIQMLKEIAGELRTKYRPYDKMRLSPWFMFFDELHSLGVVGRINRIVAQLTLWLLPLVVLFLFSLLVIRTHNLKRSILEWFISCLGSLVIWSFWLRYDSYDRPRAGEDSKSGVFDLVVLSNYLRPHRGKVIVALVLFVTYMFLLLLILDINKLRPSFFNLNLRGDSLVSGDKGDGRAYSVDLAGANLTGANLESTDLTKAYLKGANLQGASLTQATFTSANLNGVALTNAMLTEAKLQNADLSKSNLSGANLNCADLSEADFRGADLSNAFLMKTNLMQARHLTIEQLSKVATLYEACLEPELLSLVEKASPELRKEPQLEQDVEKTYVFDEKLVRNDLAITSRVESLKAGSDIELYSVMGSTGEVYAISGKILSSSPVIIRSDEGHVRRNVYVYAQSGLAGRRYLVVVQLPATSFPCSEW